LKVSCVEMFGCLSIVVQHVTVGTGNIPFYRGSSVDIGASEILYNIFIFAIQFYVAVQSFLDVPLLKLLRSSEW
jgi:hypothetical protein